MAALNGVQFSYSHDDREGLNWVNAHRGDEHVGSMSWQEHEDPELGINRGEISDLAVHPSHRRQGIATGMLHYARNLSSEFGIAHPQHSPNLSPEGRDWAQSVGGGVPSDYHVGQKMPDSYYRNVLKLGSR